MNYYNHRQKRGNKKGSRKAPRIKDIQNDNYLINPAK